MASFFQASILAARKAPGTLVAKCGACGLLKACRTPKMAATGEGRRGILIVLDAPSKGDDERSRMLSGDAGRLLKDTIRENRIDIDRDCVTTHALICHPHGGGTSQQVDYCRPHLLQTIRDMKPTTIILAGQLAVRSVIGHVFKENDIGPISRWTGWEIPSQTLNAWIHPVAAPSYVLSQDRNPVNLLLFKRHIRAACKKSHKPWDRVPDYKAEVELLYDPDCAAKAIRKLTKAPLAAFDYETTALKPENKGAATLCCSISTGDRTIAFPWTGRVVGPMRDFIEAGVGKIASNLKFEDRWSRTALKSRVRNWEWDTMVAAHCLDNRPGITSLKFQAFINLGFGGYDEHIKPFLKAGDGELNTAARDIDMDQLLLYCGLDSLLEYRVAEMQMAKIRS